MKRWAELYGMAALHRGGEALLEAMLYQPLSQAELDEVSDDRWLSAFSHCVFRAGFSWDVVRKKWPDHETVFKGFDTWHCALLSPEDLEALAKDRRIIRNPQSIKAVRDNAVFIRELRTDFGERGRALARWPEHDQIGLMAEMKKHGARLGGMAGCHALRRVGKSAFVLTRDVNAALVRDGVIDKPATSKRDLRQVQDAFNRLQDESGRPLSQISQVLAFSLGPRT